MILRGSLALLLFTTIVRGQTPVIGGSCSLSTKDVQIGGKQTQFYLKCEPSSESGAGEGVWVVKSRAAAPTSGVSSHSRSSSLSNQLPLTPSKSGHPKQMRKPANICEEDINAREGDSCAVSTTCLQSHPDQPSAYLQCEQTRMVWMRKECHEGTIFNFEQQACIVPKRIHSLSRCPGCYDSTSCSGCPQSPTVITLPASFSNGHSRLRNPRSPSDTLGTPLRSSSRLISKRASSLPFPKPTSQIPDSTVCASWSCYPCESSIDCPSTFKCVSGCCHLSTCPNGRLSTLPCKGNVNCPGREECILGGCCHFDDSRKVNKLNVTKKYKEILDNIKEQWIREEEEEADTSSRVFSSPQNNSLRKIDIKKALPQLRAILFKTADSGDLTSPSSITLLSSSSLTYLTTSSTTRPPDSPTRNTTSAPSTLVTWIYEDSKNSQALEKAHSAGTLSKFSFTASKSPSIDVQTTPGVGPSSQEATEDKMDANNLPVPMSRSEVPLHRLRDTTRGECRPIPLSPPCSLWQKCPNDEDCIDGLCCSRPPPPEACPSALSWPSSCERVDECPIGSTCVASVCCPSEQEEGTAEDNNIERSLEDLPSQLIRSISTTTQLTSISTSTITSSSRKTSGSLKRTGFPVPLSLLTLPLQSLTKRICRSGEDPLSRPSHCESHADCPGGYVCERRQCCPAVTSCPTSHHRDEPSVAVFARGAPTRQPRCIVSPRCSSTALCPPGFTCSLDGRCCRLAAFCPDGVLSESLCSPSRLCASSSHSCLPIASMIDKACCPREEDAQSTTCPEGSQQVAPRIGDYCRYSLHCPSPYFCDRAGHCCIDPQQNPFDDRRRRLL